MQFARLSLVLLAASSAVAQYTAIVNIYGTTSDPNVRGWVRFSQATPSDDVNVTVSLTGITADGGHAIQINQWGDISDTAGAATGSIWNPTSDVYACPPTSPRALGNLGSWNATGGAITETRFINLLTLAGANSIIGRSLVLRSNPDDCTNAPTDTISAQGVIALDQNSQAVTSASDATRATCFYNPTGFPGYSGQAWFAEGTNIWAQVQGITGVHAFHIHAWGDISNLANTGAHYDPWLMPHGIPPYPKRHVGDLGNIYYYSSDNVTAYYAYLNNDYVHLTGNNSIIGRAAVVHADPDVCTTMWGARILGCVIGIANPDTFPTTPVPNTVPTTQPNNYLCRTNTALNWNVPCSLWIPDVSIYQDESITFSVGNTFPDVSTGIQHNIIQVTQQGYESCNATGANLVAVAHELGASYTLPLAAGLDLTYGDHYFICTFEGFGNITGFPLEPSYGGHCAMVNMKVVVHVINTPRPSVVPPPPPPPPPFPINPTLATYANSVTTQPWNSPCINGTSTLYGGGIPSEVVYAGETFTFAINTVPVDPHNIIEVTEDGYNNCDGSTAARFVRLWSNNTANATLALRAGTDLSAGVHYFICTGGGMGQVFGGGDAPGIGGHCFGGMKMTVNVLSTARPVTTTLNWNVPCDFYIPEVFVYANESLEFSVGNTYPGVVTGIQHNIIEVTQQGYQSCNATSSFVNLIHPSGASYTVSLQAGQDLTYGDHYYMCTFEGFGELPGHPAEPAFGGHCAETNMKVIVHVINTTRPSTVPNPPPPPGLPIDTVASSRSGSTTIQPWNVPCSGVTFGGEIQPLTIYRGETLDFAVLTAPQDHHNLIEVTQQGYTSCDASTSDLYVRTLISDTFNQTRVLVAGTNLTYGTHYFICTAFGTGTAFDDVNEGAGGHCLLGMKMNVTAVDSERPSTTGTTGNNISAASPVTVCVWAVVLLASVVTLVL